MIERSLGDRSYHERASLCPDNRRYTPTSLVCRPILPLPILLTVPMSSLGTVPDQRHHPPNQPEMDLPSTRPKSNIRTRWRCWRNIHALFRETYRHHKRAKPLGAGPGVRQSILVIFKYSCEHHPLAARWRSNSFPWSV